MASLKKQIFWQAFSLCFLAIPALIYWVTRNLELMFYFFAGEMIAVGLLGWSLLRTVFDPLTKITAHVHELKSGNLDAPLDVVAGDGNGIEKLAQSLTTLQSSLRDLRRLHEEKILRAHEATAAAINAFPHAVAVLSPEAKIELVNHAAERFFGWKPGDEIQNSPQAWLEPLVSRALETGQSADPKPGDPAVQVFDHARELFFRPRAIPAKDAAGKVVGVTVVLVDATQLRQIDEAKSGLGAAVSHELKTPLTSIQMALHLLLDDAPAALSPRQLELLKTACGDADRLHELIQNLLDAGRRGAPSA